MQRLIRNRIIMISLMWLVIAFILSILPDSNMLSSALMPDKLHLPFAHEAIAVATDTAK